METTNSGTDDVEKTHDTVVAEVRKANESKMLRRQRGHTL